MNVPPPPSPDFSLVLGGPLFQLLRHVHLTSDALTLVRWRIIAFLLVTWFPLLALCALEGNLWGGTAAVPFLKDVEAHTRLLVALPLLLVAEYVVHRRIQPLPRQFLESDLLVSSARPRFETAMVSALRLRNSVLFEVLLVAFVYGVGVFVVWRHYVAFDTSTWYAAPTAAGPRPRWAGLWYGWVSLPVFQILLCRWYFRLLVWARFLWQVSRLPMQLVPTHPDRVGGLGFLSQTAYAFSALAGAHGALLAGALAGRIFHLEASLVRFKAEIAVMVLFLLGVVFGPLLVFARQLAAAKRTGLREYGILAGRYAREFEAKWTRGSPPADEPLLGSADIQSLADLANSYEVVRAMRFAPISRHAILALVSWTLLPLAPLLLSVMPLEELLKTLTSVLF